MPSQPRNDARRGGFTLIELLAVILIVGILATILISQLGGAQKAANVQSTKMKLAKLGAVLTTYDVDKGDWPPSSFSDEQGVANDGTNVGIEALVAALWSNDYDAGGSLAEETDRLANVDGDFSSKSLTDFGTRGLFEIVDAFGNPIAYFHRRDYEVKDRIYVTYDPETGEEIRSTPKAFYNQELGQFYQKNKYQFISAGPDATFGNEDDITAFDRN